MCMLLFYKFSSYFHRIFLFLFSFFFFHFIICLQIRSKDIFICIIYMSIVYAAKKKKQNTKKKYCIYTWIHMPNNINENKRSGAKDKANNFHYLLISINKICMYILVIQLWHIDGYAKRFICIYTPHPPIWLR